jgi:uncharacterized membrane protein
MIEFLAPVVLLANGLAAGVLAGAVLGGLPLLLTLPVDRYVHAHGFFGTRYDPFMPICLIVTLVGDLVLSVLAPARAVVPFAVAGLLAAAVVTISLTKNAPVNRWMAALNPEDLPADFEDPRRSWSFWHRLRTVLAVVALVSNVVAIGLLI